MRDKPVVLSRPTIKLSPAFRGATGIPAALQTYANKRTNVRADAGGSEIAGLTGMHPLAWRDLVVLS